LFKGLDAYTLPLYLYCRVAAIAAVEDKEVLIKNNKK